MTVGPASASAISTVCHVTDEPLKDAGGRPWRLSATLVGLVAMVVAGWAVDALDIDNSGSLYFVAWLALAFGFIGIATVVLVPHARSRQRRGLARGARRS
jgi:uncharacterized membrane protein HdeD (DUF308 family)